MPGEKLVRELQVFTNAEEEKQKIEKTIGIDKDEMKALKQLRKTLNESRQPKEEEGTVEALTLSGDKKVDFDLQVDKLREGLDVEKGLTRDFKEHLARHIGEQLMLLNTGSIIEIDGKKHDIYEYYKDIMESLFGKGEVLTKNQLVLKFEGRLGKVNDSDAGYLSELGKQLEISKKTTETKDVLDNSKKSQFLVLVSVTKKSDSADSDVKKIINDLNDTSSTDDLNQAISELKKLNTEKLPTALKNFLATLSETKEGTAKQPMDIVNTAFGIIGKYYERRKYIKAGLGTFQSNVQYSDNEKLGSTLIDPKIEGTKPAISFSKAYESINKLATGEESDINKVVTDILAAKNGKEIFITYRTLQTTLTFKKKMNVKLKKYDESTREINLELGKNITLAQKLQFVKDYASEIEYASDLMDKSSKIDGEYGNLYDLDSQWKQSKVPLKDLVSGILKQTLFDLESNKNSWTDTTLTADQAEKAKTDLKDLLTDMGETNSNPFMIDRLFEENLKNGIENWQADLDFISKNSLDRADKKGYLDQISSVKVLRSRMIDDLKNYSTNRILDLQNLTHIDDVAKFGELLKNNQNIKEIHLNMDLFSLDQAHTQEFLKALSQSVRADQTVTIDAKFLSPEQITLLNTTDKKYKLVYNTQSINNKQLEALGGHKGDLSLPQLEVASAEGNISSEQAFRNFLQKWESKNIWASLELGMPMLKDSDAASIKAVFGETKEMIRSRNSLKFPNLRSLYGNVYETLINSKITMSIPALNTKFAESARAQEEFINALSVDAKSMELGGETIPEKLLPALSGLKSSKIGLGIKSLDEKLVKALTIKCPENANNKLPAPYLKTLDLYNISEISTEHINAFLKKWISGLNLNNIKKLDDKLIAGALNKLTSLELKAVKKLSPEIFKTLVENSEGSLDLSGVTEVDITNGAAIEGKKPDQIYTILDSIARKGQGNIVLGDLKKIPTGRMVNWAPEFIENSTILSNRFLPYAKKVFETLKEKELEGNGKVQLQWFLGRHYQAYKKNPEKYGY